MSDDIADRLFFRQLLSGRDYATDNQMARQMVNFVYAIGDRKSGECVLVDPAYSVRDLTNLVEAEGMKVTGVLATHYHADHVGGSMMGHAIEGVATLLETGSVPVHVNKHEVPWVTRTTGLSESDLVAHDSGDTVKVGVRIREGNKERVQPYEGVVITKRHGGLNETITVRRIFQGIGVERVFMLHSPQVASVKVERRGKVRRAKLFYLRDRVGKATRVKQRFDR